LLYYASNAQLGARLMHSLWCVFRHIDSCVYVLLHRTTCLLWTTVLSFWRVWPGTTSNFRGKQVSRGWGGLQQEGCELPGRRFDILKSEKDDNFNLATLSGSIKLQHK